MSNKRQLQKLKNLNVKAEKCLTRDEARNILIKAPVCVTIIALRCNFCDFAWWFAISFSFWTREDCDDGNEYEEGDCDEKLLVVDEVHIGLVTCNERVNNLRILFLSRVHLR